MLRHEYSTISESQYKLISVVLQAIGRIAEKISPPAIGSPEGMPYDKRT